MSGWDIPLGPSGSNIRDIPDMSGDMGYGLFVVELLFAGSMGLNGGPPALSSGNIAEEREEQSSKLSRTVSI